MPNSQGLTETGKLPGKQPVFSMRVQGDLHCKIVEIAAEKDRPVAWVIRHLLIVGLHQARRTGLAIEDLSRRAVMTPEALAEYVGVPVDELTSRPELHYAPAAAARS